MHKIRTLFWSRNITRLARWRGLPRLHASLHRSAIKLDFSISHDRNSVLILCIIVVAVFVFGQGSITSVHAGSTRPAGRSQVLTSKTDQFGKGATVAIYSRGYSIAATAASTNTCRIPREFLANCSTVQTASSYHRAHAAYKYAWGRQRQQQQ